MSNNIEYVINDYKAILKVDGRVSSETLLEMLKIDVEIPEKYKNEKGYNDIVERIISPGPSDIKEIRRMSMYGRGADLEKIAETEGRSIETIYQWFKARGINLKKDRSTGMETVGSI